MYQRCHIHGTKQKCTRRAQVYDPEVNKNITRRSYDNILIPDTVIDRVNLLGKHQEEILVFTYCEGIIIGGGDVNLTGVDGYGDENEAPLKIES